MRLDVNYTLYSMNFQFPCSLVCIFMFSGLEPLARFPCIIPQLTDKQYCVYLTWTSKVQFTRTQTRHNKSHLTWSQFPFCALHTIIPQRAVTRFEHTHAHVNAHTPTHTVWKAIRCDAAIKWSALFLLIRHNKITLLDCERECERQRERAHVRKQNSSHYHYRANSRLLYIWCSCVRGPGRIDGVHWAFTDTHTHTLKRTAITSNGNSSVPRCPGGGHQENVRTAQWKTHWSASNSVIMSRAALAHLMNTYTETRVRAHTLCNVAWCALRSSPS